MEEKSPELYVKLKDTVLEALEVAMGKSQAELIDDEIKRLDRTHKNKKHTEKDAVNEIVARACEDMLSMSKEGRKLFDSMTEEEKKTFVGKIKELLKNLLEWVEELLGLYESTSYEAKIMKQYQAELNKLVETWDKALVEMSEINKATKDAVQDSMNTKNSQKDGEIDGAEGYNVDTRYAMKGRFRSEYKWHTGLTKAQVTKVEEWIERAGKPESKKITDTAYWYRGRLNGDDLFVIYSTEDDKATVLYLKKGRKANTELNILLDLLEENENGDKKRTHPNGKPVFTQRVSEGNWVLKNKVGSEYSLKKLVSQLDELYSYIGQAKELTWEDVFGRSYYIAKAILNEARPKVETNDRCKTILKEIRRKRISLNDEQKAEAEQICVAFCVAFAVK